MSRRLLALVALVVAAGCALGANVRGTYGGHAAVDEPEYLLTALSLGEDGDLSVADELRERRWTAFHGEAELPEQTRELAGGRRVSPHDPLLPVVLALPMRLGGFVAAKLTIAALAGCLAALTVWTAVRRYGVPARLAAPGVVTFSLSPPLAVYGSQVYPELPAALAVTAAVAAPGPAGAGVAAVALPWLSVKYVPVAAALAALALWRSRSRLLLGWLAVSGVVYLAGHRLLYGGWTAYATGDHFVSTGEFSVVGTSPDYLGRASRLVGLLADREFGLLPWQPAWLLVVPAVAALVRRRPPGWAELAAPLAAGWLTATFLALTMHGYWWPGRQLVVVLPLAVLAVLWWARESRPRAAALYGLGALGVLAYGWLLADGWARRLTWVTGFAGVGDPVYRALRLVLPDYRDLGARTWLLHAAWALVLLVLLRPPIRRVLPHVRPPSAGLRPRADRRPRRV